MIDELNIYDAICQDCGKSLGHRGDGEFFIWENEPMCDDCYGEGS